MSDPLSAGHAGESPYRYDPAARLQLSYAFQPPDPDRIARAYPPRDRCTWSPEIARKRTREMERDRQGLRVKVVRLDPLPEVVEKE